MAITRINEAIDEIKRAAIDDGKDLRERSVRHLDEAIYATHQAIVDAGKGL
ncbi:MAG: hypothetical protein H7172_02695 [Ferruginibacter sp.]|nr:hypothetical protein [Rhodoferax sp.]